MLDSRFILILINFDLHIGLVKSSASCLFMTGSTQLARGVDCGTISHFFLRRMIKIKINFYKVISIIHFVDYTKIFFVCSCVVFFPYFCCVKKKEIIIVSYMKRNDKLCSVFFS